MTTLSILQELQDRDISLVLEGENLKISGRRDLLTPDLLEQLKAAKPEILKWLAACDAASLLPLTDMQKAYLYGREEGVPLGGVSSHVYHEFDGCWDIDRLRAALASVIDRHDALRMVITAEGAKVLPQGCSLARIAVSDLTGETASRQAAALSEVRERMSHQVLDARFGVLVHLHISLLAADKMRLHVSHDGLVIDGLSMLGLFVDLGQAYAGDRLVPLECDFASQLDLLDKGTGNVAAARAYWQTAAPALPPAPDLPLAADPEKITAPRSTRHLARLSAAQWDAFRNNAKELELSPSAALGAAFCEVLSLWTGGTDFSLNMTIANRVPVHPDAFAVIGNFTQPCPVPFLHDRPTAAARAKAFGQALRTGVEHRHLSGVEVLRTLARPDGGGLLLPVTLNCAFGAPEAFGHRHAFEAFGSRVYAISQTPQVWLNGFAFETGAGLEIEFDAVEGLFPKGVVAGIVTAFEALLGQLTDKATWEAATFDLLPRSVQEVRATRNDTATPLPPFLLQDDFIARAHQSPDAPALICTDETVTYGALLERACGVATWLRDHGLAQEALVGVVMHKGWEQIAAALGILMAGGAYLPVDAAFPTDRIAAVLDRGDSELVLTTPSVAPALSAITDPKAVLLVTDRLKGSVKPFLPDNRRAQSADTLAYVLFTSGSTGVPKGVMIPHSNAVNLVRDINDRFAVTSKDRLFGISAFNFDLSVYDIFGGLAAGAAIVLPAPESALDPEAWARQAAAHDVTLWNSVPAIAQMLLESDTGLSPRLRVMMMSGDKIPSHLPHALVSAKPDLQVMSLGGPTETTVWNILNDVTDLPQDATLVPYGYPNANNRAYILDAMGRPCPDWVAGELHAAGAGVARGYWKDPERTAQAFFHHDGLDERLYATGDVARYRPDGLIEILGRSDFQVKINGFRVELSEVETHLTAHPMVQRVVVTALSGPQGSLLAAVVVPQDGHSLQGDDLRDYLADRLPAYMVPSVYAMRDSLPLTANGKVDRKSLGDLRVDIAPTQTQSAPSAPEGEMERKIAEIWESVLQRPVVDANMRLAELGGSSLSAVRIATQVGRETGVRLPIRNLDRYDTVRAQARQVIACGLQDSGGVTDMLDTKSPSAPDRLLDDLFAVIPATDRSITVYRSGSKTTLSHAELMDQVSRVAVQLDALGVRPGDRIGICAANRIEWLLLDLAALRLGLVVAGFKPGDFTADQTLIDTYGLALLFADTQAAGVTPFEALSPASGPTGPLPPNAPRRSSNAMALKFTSGSTGAAKGLAASYGSVGMSLSAVQEMFAHGRDDRLFVFLTLSLLQQRYWVYSALLFGCDLVISTAQLALHAMRDSSPTVIMGVPAFFETLKEMIDASGGTSEAARAVTGGKVRYMWTGSAPIREELLRCFDEDYGLPLFEGYGMNESCIVTKNHFGAHRRGSAGQPVHGKEVWIGDDGIIRIRSACPVAREYAFAPEGASGKIFEADGVIVTGDIGEIDADGYLWVKGRADDVVVLENATNILARPIEERLMAIEGVRHVIVCGTGKPHLSAIVDIAAGFDAARVLEAVRAVPPATPNEAIRTVVAARMPFTEDNGLLTSQGKPRRMTIVALHTPDLETPQLETPQKETL